MARDFNITFNNTIFDNLDNFLESTKVTKVTLVGSNSFQSLDSAFKDCSELFSISGALNLDKISNISSLLKNSPLVTSIVLHNINNPNIKLTDALNDVEFITLGGNLYKRSALQKVISSKDWNFKGFTYEGVVLENIYDKQELVEHSNRVLVQDSLEAIVLTLEVMGCTYENILDGKKELSLTDEFILDFNIETTSVLCSKFFPIYLDYLEGTPSGLGELQDNGTYKIELYTDNGYSKLWEEL
jgi:hypothetical protein